MKVKFYILLTILAFLFSGAYLFWGNTSDLSSAGWVWLLSTFTSSLLLILVIISIFTNKDKSKKGARLKESLKNILQKDERILCTCPLIHPQWQKVEMLYVTDTRIFTINVEKENPTFSLGKEIFYDRMSSVTLKDKFFSARIGLDIVLKDSTSIIFETNKTQSLKNVYKIIRDKSSAYRPG